MDTQITTPAAFPSSQSLHAGGPTECLPGSATLLTLPLQAENDEVLLPTILEAASMASSAEALSKWRIRVSLALQYWLSQQWITEKEIDRAVGLKRSDKACHGLVDRCFNEFVELLDRKLVGILGESLVSEYGHIHSVAIVGTEDDYTQSSGDPALALFYSEDFVIHDFSDVGRLPDAVANTCILAIECVRLYLSYSLLPGELAEQCGYYAHIEEYQDIEQAGAAGSVDAAWKYIKEHSDQFMYFAEYENAEDFAEIFRQTAEMSIADRQWLRRSVKCQNRTDAVLRLKELYRRHSRKFGPYPRLREWVKSVIRVFDDPSIEGACESSLVGMPYDDDSFASLGYGSFINTGCTFFGMVIDEHIRCYMEQGTEVCYRVQLADVDIERIAREFLKEITGQFLLAIGADAIKASCGAN